MRSYLGRLWSESRLAGAAVLAAALGLTAFLPLPPALRPLPGLALFVLGFALFDAMAGGRASTGRGAGTTG
jgi:hypothetical protein